jgi:hypothetical protein
MKRRFKLEFDFEFCFNGLNTPYVYANMYRDYCFKHNFVVGINLCFFVMDIVVAW